MDLLTCLKIRASVRAYIGLLRCFKEQAHGNLCMAAAVRESSENCQVVGQVDLSSGTQVMLGNSISVTGVWDK